MKELFRHFFGMDNAGDALPGRPYRIAGSAVIVVGLAVLSPGISDALLAYANNSLELGLSLDAPWWIGLPLIALGALLFILGFATDRAGTSTGQFLAIRHQSFRPLAPNLPTEALPKRMQRRKINVYDCDLSSFMNTEPVDPTGAVRQQERLASHITGVRQSDPDAAVGYYGIVHIPFQFLAGCSISTYPEVALFELNRSDNKWYELKSGAGTDLKPTLRRTIDPLTPTAAVLRIEVSYPVAAEEVVRVIPAPFREYTISIAQPAIDKVTHYDHVDSICDLFRQALDEIHNELGSGPTIHVFYAGPVSLGFSLGRRISRTIHNQVFVYNYTSKATPAYSWGVDVTRDAPANTMVLHPKLVQL